MKILQKTGMLMIAGFIVAGVCQAQEQEKKIKRSDLPPAVEKAVAAQSAGATIKGFNEERKKARRFMKRK